MGWVLIDGPLDAAGLCVQTRWIIDVLAQYLISCDDHMDGVSDASAEPAFLPRPNSETQQLADSSVPVLELKDDVAHRCSNGLDPVGGLFLEHIASVRRKKIAASRTRQDLIALQAEFGLPLVEHELWFSTLRPGPNAPAAGQELVVYADLQSDTDSYPSAWIAFYYLEDQRTLTFWRPQHEPGETHIADTEFLISSDVSS